MEKYLGIDWGEKRIGLALGDSETKIATPFKVVGDLVEVVKSIKEEEINKVIIGEPLGMANVKGLMANEVIDFIHKLEKEIDVPIIKVDERLSSKGADALPGNKKEKSSRDEIAAMLILQTYLDRQN